jgi:hypothetical protein
MACLQASAKTHAEIDRRNRSPNPAANNPWIRDTELRQPSDRVPALPKCPCHIRGDDFWGVHRNEVGKGSSIYDQDRVGLGMTERRSAIIALQFLIGGVVTMGGTLFATLAVNSLGRSLGLIHLSMGVAGILSGVAFLQAKPWSRSLLLAINAVSITYSSFSESVVEIQSLLPPYASIGSLIGTLIAIIMSFAVIALLLSALIEPAEGGWGPVRSFWTPWSLAKARTGAAWGA